MAVLQRFRSVRARITIASTVLVAATLMVASLAIMNLVRADLLASAEQALADALQEQAEDFGFGEEILLDEPGYSSFFVPVEIDGRVAELGLFTEEFDGLAYGDLTIDGDLVASVVLDPVTGEIVEVLDPSTGFPVENVELVEELEDLLFEVFEPELAAEIAFENDGASVPLLVGAAPLDEIEQSIDALQQALMMIVPLLVLVFGLLTWWLVGRALRPVVAITEQVEAISSTRLDRRVPVPETGDEVSELATVMNRMLTRLQRGGERQRQFSADASHELRSPLSTVRAAAELIGRSPTADRTPRLADQIVSETDRMDELIGDLLELSRLDEDRRDHDLEPVDLVDLVRTEAIRIGGDPSDEGRAGRPPVEGFDDVVIEVVAPPGGISVVGAPRQLRRLMTNLIENAHRHAERRVVVTVVGGRTDPMTLTSDGVIVAVDDDGPGVPPDMADVIFERFSRVDESRGRAAGGSGLGLALVRAIAERHGATVEVGAADIGGARFEVRFGPGPQIGPDSQTGPGPQAGPGADQIA